MKTLCSLIYSYNHPIFLCFFRQKITKKTYKLCLISRKFERKYKEKKIERKSKRIKKAKENKK